MWSYDPEMSEPKDKVRLLIGDTLDDDPQFQDEELNFFLSESSSNVYGAAVRAVRVLIAKYSRYADKWVGDLKILASQKARAYKTLLDELQTAASSQLTVAGVPTAGGVYIAEKEAMQQRGDVVQPSFRRGDMDFARDWDPGDC